MRRFSIVHSDGTESGAVGPDFMSRYTPPSSYSSRYRNRSARAGPYAGSMER